MKNKIILYSIVMIAAIIFGLSAINADTYTDNTLIQVDGGDLSGCREPNAVVDVGYGDREYYSYTNEYGQLVKVTADEVILQDDETEPVLSNGRYYWDEAKVPGTESPDYDEGHVIADSLGGVSNAYNITPQDSTLNRHGDQSYMEKTIRDAGGCEDFVAIITYSDTDTQIPSHYSYTYTVNGEVVQEEFDNVNPKENSPQTGACFIYPVSARCLYCQPLTQEHLQYPLS